MCVCACTGQIDRQIDKNHLYIRYHIQTNIYIVDDPLFCKEWTLCSEDFLLQSAGNLPTNF